MNIKYLLRKAFLPSLGTLALCSFLSVSVAGTVASTTKHQLAKQEQPTLSNQDSKLTNGRLYDSYHFTGKKGQLIEINVSSLEFYGDGLEVLNASGETIEYASVQGSTRERDPQTRRFIMSVTRSYRLPEDGSYTIRVSGQTLRSSGGWAPVNSIPENTGYAYTITAKVGGSAIALQSGSAPPVSQPPAAQTPTAQTPTADQSNSFAVGDFVIFTHSNGELCLRITELSSDGTIEAQMDSGAAGIFPPPLLKPDQGGKCAAAFANEGSNTDTQAGNRTPTAQPPTARTPASQGGQTPTEQASTAQGPITHNPSAKNPLNAELTLYVDGGDSSQEEEKKLKDAGYKFTVKDIRQPANRQAMQAELLKYFDGNQSKVNNFLSPFDNGSREYPLAVWHSSVGSTTLGWWSEAYNAVSRSFGEFEELEAGIQQFVSNASSMSNSRWLDAHNEHRRKVKSPDLTWDAGLAAYATEWAEKLAAEAEAFKSCRKEGVDEDNDGADDGVIYHRSEVGMDPKRAGENINCFPLVSSPHGVDFKYPSDTIIAYVRSEGPDARRGSYWVPSRQSCSDGQTGCFHYTQIVDQRSSKLGCGYALFGDNNFVITVCNFDPPGNATEQPGNRLPNLYPGLTQTR